jgi:ATP-binding cassette subfamily B protein
MRRILVDLSRIIEFDLRNAFFARLTVLDPAFYDAQNTGDLMSRGTNDMEAVRLFIGPSVMYFANTVFSTPLVLAQMFALDWRLTLATLVPMVAVPPLVIRLGRESHARGREQQDEFGNLSTVAQENLAGIQVVKAYRQEAAQTGLFARQNDRYVDRSLAAARVQAVFFPLLRLVISTGFISIILLGGWDVMENGAPLGTIISMVLLYGMIVWPMVAIGWVVNSMQRGMASLERISDVLHAEPLVKAPAAPLPMPPQPSVEFRHLTFQYPATQAPQLVDISVSVPAGSTLGIIGPVGSGKSTLVNLLARLYPVERGMVLIGGQDINDIGLEELRRRLGFVFQETFLFSDTIEWNVRFGAPDGAPADAVVAAARQAHIHGEIERMPHGYQTELGERGINLSGGQRQRLAIARAIARDAAILVLDDALSAVDTHTEDAILGELRAIMAGRTVFLISHRVSTVALADQIIVLEAGRITQRGTHGELAAQPGLYQRLHQRQLLESEAEALDPEPIGGGAR